VTHISEAEFCTEYVEPLLSKHFGEDSWERTKWLDRTGCYADYWVDLGVFIAAIEVENDADSIRNGVGQAIEYAQNHPRAVPMVLTPEGHVETAQVEALRPVCPIIEVPTSAESSV
jgi:hypothetical protein